MRIPAKVPVILALAVIILTPANIRDVVGEAVDTARVALGKWLGPSPSVAVASVAPPAKPSGDGVSLGAKSN